MQHAAFRARDYEFSIFLLAADGDQLNITGSTWTLKLYRLNETEVVLSTVPAVGSAAGGRLDVAVPAASMTIAGGLYVGELVRTDTGADVYGRFQVSVADVGQRVAACGNITLRQARGGLA